MEDKVRNFVLSDLSREKVLCGDDDAPDEFVEIARTVLAGHFLVANGNHSVRVHPTCIEFYYHEEQCGGIKDYVVYHRNSTSLKPIFPLGTLHNHVSGIDITFESGSSPGAAVRASVLIREFSVEGMNDDRSTMLYDALYQQSSVFSGIAVKWEDGERPVDVVSSVRKNVALYDCKGNKVRAVAGLALTENKEYAQDTRKWQFRRRLVDDAETNFVYISSWLKDECPAFCNRFLTHLRENGIAYGILNDTNDIWARDYMPVQVYDGHFLQYRFNPDYLQDSEEGRESITDTDAVCRKLGLRCHKTGLVIDGGNVVKAGRYAIMTEKVYAENSSLPPAEIRSRLKAALHRDVIMLPWDREERYGHADGIVRGVDDDTVLLTNYADFDPGMAARFESILSRHFKVKTLHYDVCGEVDANSWAYINFLRVGDNIIIPGLGTAEDRQALLQIRGCFPGSKVSQVDAAELVAKGGGLNCVTWNVRLQA